MIIKEKASATGFLAACIFIYMLLVGLKFKYLVFMNAITLPVAFHCQFSFRDRQILPCLFAMASADINPARLHFDPVYLYKSCVFIRQTGPYPVLPFQLFGRQQFLWSYKETVFPGRLYQLLKFDSKSTCDLSEYAKRGIGSPSLYLSVQACFC